MILDLTKPLQTRDGRPARMLGTLNKPTTEHLVFAITHDDQEFVIERSTDGRRFPGQDIFSDIINAPEPKPAVYVNVYRENGGLVWGGVFSSRNAAEPTFETDERVGCIRVELAERFDP